MQPEYYSDLGRKLDTLNKGDEIRLTYAKQMGYGSDEQDELRLVVIEPPSGPSQHDQTPKRMSSVINTIDAQAELNKDISELIESGVQTVYIQSSREHQTARYEIRDLQNRDVDGASVVDIEVIGRREIPE